MGQWQAILAGAFTPDQEFSRFPIEIIESQGGHFTGP
jgi:hypothetical protein